MNWKNIAGLALTAVLAVAVLGGCGLDTREQKAASKDKVHLTVFAAASMTETMNQIAEKYQKDHPNVEITFNYDSSGTLKKTNSKWRSMRFVHFSSAKADESARCIPR